MKKKKKNSSQAWIGIVVTIVCLVAIFFFIEPAQIWAALKEANYWYLLLTGLGLVLFLVIRAWRWRFMLENDVPTLPIFHVQNIGYLVNAYLPLRLGDMTQAVLIGNVPPVTIARGVSTVVMARIVDMTFMVILLLFTLTQVETMPEQVQSTTRIFGGLVTAAVVLLAAAANQRPFVRKRFTLILNWLTQVSHTAAQRLEQKITHAERPLLYKPVHLLFSTLSHLDTQAWIHRIDDFLMGLNSLTHLKSSLILITYTIFIWLPIIGAYYTGMLAVHLEPTIPMAAFAVCIAAFSVAAPSSPGQVGVFHAGVIFALYNILGQPEAQAASFAFLYHAVMMMVTTVMGIISLWATGATFRHVIDTTRNYLNKKEAKRKI
ncbi:MAG: hypothetical protein CSB13_04020 [Chloroflexi bacterium]|nr:MAG: hypothetical protein CSB13_04020 [Chloroflexota bacterium]